MQRGRGPPGPRAHLLQQPGRVYVQLAAPLHDVNRPVLAPELVHNIAVHKHRNQRACGEPPFVGLGRSGQRGVGGSSLLLSWGGAVSRGHITGALALPARPSPGRKTLGVRGPAASAEWRGRPCPRGCGGSTRFHPHPSLMFTCSYRQGFKVYTERQKEQKPFLKKPIGRNRCIAEFRPAADQPQERRPRGEDRQTRRPTTEQPATN